MTSTTSTWRGKVGNEHGAFHRLAVMMNRAFERRCSTERDAVPEEATNADSLVGRHIEGFCRFTIGFRSVQRIDASFLSKGDVVAEHVGVDLHVEGARPRRVPENLSELVLIVRLRHEDMGSSKTAADRPGEVHAAGSGSFLMRMRSRLVEPLINTHGIRTP